jgi:tetratricopeptide (TPR) repeat protein
MQGGEKVKRMFSKVGYKGLTYGLGLFFFAWIAYIGCASGPKITPEQEAALRAQEQAKQDSIRRFEAAKNWSLGHENYKNKEYDRVAKYFWKVIELDKEHRFKDVYTFLAQTYFQLGKIDSAIAEAIKYFKV